MRYVVVMLKISKKRTPLVSHQMAFLTIIGFWIFHALVVSLRATIMEFPEQGELATRRIVVTLVGMSLTWLLYLFLRFLTENRSATV